MKTKSRFFSSLLIAIVTALGYYALTDFKINDIQIKIFSSLGMPYKMFEINNSVKQKKLPLPKIIYSFAVQQDELKSSEVNAIAENSLEVDEFIAGLTTGLMNAEKKQRVQQPKLNDKVKYGVTNEAAEVEEQYEVEGADVSKPYIYGYSNTAPECNSFTYTTKITQDDIEMYVNSVTVKNPKKIEECFKKVKVIYGNKDAERNIIVNVTVNPNKELRNTINRNTRIKSATAALDEDENRNEEYLEEED